MKAIRTAIPDVIILEPRRFGDDRGWFMETFNEPKFHQLLNELGLPRSRAFVQDNHSCSARGVLRGLHYQLPPHAQGKLVRVSKGAAYDVAVDIRRDSPTFGQWVGVELSAQNQQQLWIPEGFAHGFMALEDGTEFLYKTTDVYAPSAERSILWNDAQLNITWPQLAGIDAPLIAAKDAAAAAFASADVF